MAVSTNSEFVDLIFPLGERLKLYEPSNPPTDQPKNDAANPTKQIPQDFIDAMIVRYAVYVEEQHIPVENELDEDDARSFHWVVYASIPQKSDPNTEPQDEKMDNGNGTRARGGRRKSTSTKVPIGTIRLVPPPHPPHPNGEETTDVQKADEIYVKLGRLAVIPDFRKAGISKLLIDTALKFIREQGDKIIPRQDPGVMESLRSHGVDVAFKGLVLVHAQTGVQKVWRKYGFVTDESMGSWDEEGIEHVGMWKRVDVGMGRRKSRGA